MPQGQRNALAAGEHVQSPLRWPLVSKLQNRNPAANLTKDARLINCYAEYDAQDQEYWIYKRLGLSATPFFSTTAAPGLGIYTEVGQGFIWAVFGTSVCIQGSFGAMVPFETVATATIPAPYFFATQGSNPNRFVVLGDGLTAYAGVVDPAATGVQRFAQITDPNFPGTFVNGFVELDSLLYVMDPNGNIFGSTIPNNPTAWSALDLIVASSESDMGVALFKHLNYIVALKQYSTQVFYDAGNATPGSPLSPVPDAQLPLGCLHANSVQSIDNSLLWITSNETISPQVVQMDNLVPRIVSTPAVERILDNIAWSSPAKQPGGILTSTIRTLDIRSWVLKHGGHRFYGLTLVALNITLVYDIDQQLWYNWTDFQGNYWPIGAMAFAAPITSQPGIHYAQHVSNGNIYALDGDYVFPNDYGNLFPVDIYTPNMDFNTVRRKYIKTMYFRADQVPQSNVQVRYSDDDYQSWSNFRTVDLSVKKPRMNDCGTFRQRRAYHIRHFKNTQFRIKTIDLAMDMGTL